MKFPGVCPGAAIVFCAAFASPSAAQVVQYDITDPGGRDLPAKITFLTPDGKVPPKLSLKSRVPEFAARKNVVYELYGKGEIPVPAGRYRAYVSRGMEWSVAVLDLSVTPDRPAVLRASLERVVDTAGFISGDLHLHTKTFSGHGDANVEERLITLCAENLEWAVATDHNRHTDYRPYARRIGADRWLITSVGNEVSSSTIGHFNTFPLDPKTKPVNHRIADARELFRKIRGNPLDEILQLNHPRWTGSGGGYFRELELSTIAGDAWSPLFSFDFDSLEILNDNSLGGWELRALPIKQDLDFDHSVREDWFNLLNRGYRFTGVGNSDSHYVEAAIGGCPRNFIMSPTDDPAAAREEDLVKAVREGRVVVSSGIFVTMKANGKHLPGSTVTGKEVELAINVQAAPWIDARRLVVIANGEPVFRADLPPAQPGEKVAVRLDASAPSPAPASPPDGEKLLPPARPVVRFSDKVRLQPETDTWYIAYAEGDEPPYPMLHKVTIPLGFTNPIWVDADGDGKFRSLRDLAAAAIAPSPGEARLRPGELTERLSRSTQAFKRQVLAAISLSASPDRIDPLAELLRDSGPAVREGAAIFLSRSGDRRARSFLVQARDRAPDPRERFIFNRELVKAGDLSALEDIRPAYAAAKDLDYFRMRRDLKEICRKNRILRWWTIGPFPAKTIEEGLAREYPPEKEIDYRRKYPGFEKKTEEWKRVSSDQGHFVSFGAMSPKENALAYAHVIVRAKAEVKTCLLLGGKSGIEIRVNGQSIHRQKTAAHGSAGSQMVPVKFKAGANSLLVKVVVEKGDFGFSLMVIDPAGDLKVEAERPPEPSARKY